MNGRRELRMRGALDSCGGIMGEAQNWAAVRRCALLAGVALAMLIANATLPGSASAVTDEQVHAHVNEVRSRMGLLPLTFDPRLSDGCRKHGRYLEQNPGAFTDHPHQERTNLPGYSPEGAEAAGGSGLSARELAYENDSTFGYAAPWHNMIVFNPFKTHLHRGTAAGYDCIGSSGEPSEEVYGPRLFVWPPSGTNSVPYEVQHSEAPYSPSRFLGLPETATVGPSLYIFGARMDYPRSFCPWDASVTLTGPEGPVEIAVIDRDSRGPAGESPYLYGGIMATVRRPLRPDTTYTLDAIVTSSSNCNSESAPFEAHSVRSTLTTVSAPIYPAKLKVRRASIRDGALDALFSITGRSTGSLTVDYQAAGRFKRYVVDVGAAQEGEKQIQLLRQLEGDQRTRSTGILNVSYSGNDATQPESLRLRAANGRSRIQRSELEFADGRLKLSGTADERLRGLVRFRATYQQPDGSVAEWTGRSIVQRGQWSIDEQLPAQAGNDPNAYLTMQFTGDLDARGGPFRGEQDGKSLGSLGR